MLLFVKVNNLIYFEQCEKLKVATSEEVYARAAKVLIDEQSR